MFSEKSDSQTLIGKVVKSTRNTYHVVCNRQEILCSIRGKLARPTRESPSSVKVGDNVQIRLISHDQGVIEEILPRNSKLSRTVEGKAYREHIIATNIDQILIIMSTQQPAFKSGLLDRYLVIAEKNHLKACICINKIDLSSREEFARYAKWYPELGYPLFFTSALTGEGVEAISGILKNKVTALVGHSGVGKSSLLKKIEPGLDLRIDAVSTKTRKGRHATSHVQLFPISIGGYVIDTPGIRELGLWDIYRQELKWYFKEFQLYQENCKFNDCLHLNEPGCAVKEAVEAGKIFDERYQNYVNIYGGLRAAPYELIKPR
ncbi:MAG: ribosome small subunit-dependent GTPase A [Calditrichia bacterium]